MKTDECCERTRVRFAHASFVSVLVLLAWAGSVFAAESGANAPPPAAAPAKGSATPESSSTKGKTKRRVQEVDLKRLEIQGKIEAPSSLFVLESGRSGLPQIKALDGLLGGSWIHPIDKEALDRLVVTGIEAGGEE